MVHESPMSATMQTETITNEIWGFFSSSSFVMERLINFPRFSFVNASEMNMLGTPKLQQQAPRLRKTAKSQRVSFVFRFVISLVVVSVRMVQYGYRHRPEPSLPFVMKANV